MSVKDLVAVSRKYGSDPDFVLAGGGNTSYKDEKWLYVKASGTSLSAIDADGFVKMDRRKLDAIWTAGYPEKTDEREAAALADLLASRAPGEENKRPSVETLMHGFFPQKYVVHTHPCLVNGLTCGKNGAAAAARLLGDIACWIPLVDPGYILAKTVKDAVDSFRARTGAVPSVVLLQNHGLVVTGDTPEEIDGTTATVLARIRADVKRDPALASAPADGTILREWLKILGPLSEGSILFETNEELLKLVSGGDSWKPVSSSFSPDHIVYSGHEPLYAREPSKLEYGWADFVKRNGTPPRIVLAEGLGLFACSPAVSRARQARDLFLDTVKVSVYAESFGGPLFMPEAMIRFIRTWEVEKYRSSVGGK